MSVTQTRSSWYWQAKGETIEKEMESERTTEKQAKRFTTSRKMA